MKLIGRLVFYGLGVAVFATGAVAKPASKPRVQTIKIMITERGYQPATLKLRKGVRARLIFLRDTDATCVREIVVPDFKIRRDLPLNQPVVLTFTPQKQGTFSFVCGMNMLRGKLVVS